MHAVYLPFQHPVWILGFNCILELKATFIAFATLHMNIRDLGLLENVRNQICVILLYPLFLGVTIERKSG